MLSLPLALAAAPQTKPRVNPNAVTIKEFLKRVDVYVALHKKLEATLPALPKQTDPTVIDKHERALARLVQEGRKDAKPGDLLFPAIQRVVRSLLRPIFTGKAGTQIRGEIVDNEYKGNVKLVVNGRYPDEVPISTVPPQVLEALPKLPEELEYRFIQNTLILFDPHAHVIADFMERAFN
ncbi:MAG TPA: hypothetical protein VNC21_12045 [Vicinamibacterales bacterium]|nr:hypothetical protein [Vicinamibacterales bacterium]